MVFVKTYTTRKRLAGLSPWRDRPNSLLNSIFSDSESGSVSYGKGIQLNFWSGSFIYCYKEFWRGYIIYTYYILVPD